jgi:hypothetical protein
MKSHIRVEEASKLRHSPSCFTRDKQPEKSPKWGHSPKWDRSPRIENNPKKCQKKPFKEHLGYPKSRASPLNTSLAEVLTAT